MDEAPRRSTSDKSFETDQLFRDVAANMARRRDAQITGEPSPRTRDDAKVIESYRWREAALSSQREIDEIWAWLNTAMHRNATFTGPACLAQIQTKEQLTAFLVDLLREPIVDIAMLVYERMRDRENEITNGDGENPQSEAEGEGEAVADAGEQTKRHKQWTDGTEIEIPY